MVNASIGGSVMKMDIDDAYELYEKFVENQSNWPIRRDFPKKFVDVHLLIQ